MSTLFEGPAPRVRAVPASAPFLDVFVDAMVSALYRPETPFALADALILLPNRRAAQGLMDAFAARLGGAALLPAIRPLGDLDDDPDVWGAEPIDLGVRPAIGAGMRRLELAALVRKKFEASGEINDPARAVAMADELCRLLDSAAAADAVDWSRLPHLVEEIDLAQHWSVSASFLEIVTAYWPARLKADGLADPAARRTELLEALARAWEQNPPPRPIVIAGSTGSIAATRRLMGVVARLPKGVVVLPGLDSDLDDAAWNAIGPQHPQFALKETLQALALPRAAIAPLCDERARGRARRVLIREALAPADATADWIRRLEDAGGESLAKTALEGMALYEAATASEEASAIALMMREALDEPARTVALVTADAQLSRRVAEKLARWGVLPNISHGRPLRETAPGALIALLCDLARDSGDCVALAGLVKHPLASFGLDEEALAAARSALEREALRGPRKHGDIADLAAKNEGAAGDLAQRIAAALAPLLAPPGETDLARFADAIVEAAEAVAQTPALPGARLWSGRAGEMMAQVLQELAADGAALGALAAEAAPRVLMKLIDGREAPPQPGGDPRCAIWGPLEARLQRRDLVILGGLNEGAWPAPPAEDPFLSRAMREKLGLPSPDVRIGLSAHDFAQLACAPHVVMTRALRQGGAPSVASRWLWRLTTLLKAARLELRAPAGLKDWTHALDAAPEATPIAAPRPTPPKHARLKSISVTGVESLIRDPYAVYAQRILKLEALKPVGFEPGAAERGTAIHKAIERSRDAQDLAGLMRELDEALAENGFSEIRRAAERARLLPSAKAWLAWATERRGVIYREIRGAMMLSSGVELRGTADRIEIVDGRAAIIDMKTGTPPSHKQVNLGLAPQLLLEAAMLARGVFSEAPAAETDELVYWRFGGAKPEPTRIKIDGAVMAAAEAALANLDALLTTYAGEAQPFLSKPRVQFIKPYADYDHFARRKEWADAEGEE